jgi:tRNA G26 N,N-dimethylase Trm1
MIRCVFSPDFPRPNQLRMQAQILVSLCLYWVIETAASIEVYVKKKKQVTRQYVTPPVWDGYQHHACMSKEVTEREDVLPEADRQMLKIVEQLADESDAHVRIYDVSTLVGRLRAAQRGVRKTPVVIIGKERIEDINIDVLKSKLQH